MQRHPWTIMDTRGQALVAEAQTWTPRALRPSSPISATRLGNAHLAAIAAYETLKLTHMRRRAVEPPASLNAETGARRENISWEHVRLGLLGRLRQAGAIPVTTPQT
jgi:hypothetical protein